MKQLTKLLISVGVVSILAGCANNAAKTMDHSSHHKAEKTAMKHDDHGGHDKHSDGHGAGHGDGHGGHHADSAVGKPAQGMAATKTYQVSMLDSMKFVFNQKPDLSPGDVVKFVVTNNGKIPHEFSIGNAAEQAKHNEMMKKMPDMQHEDGNTVTVQPGQRKELVWQFAGHDEVVFACNVPGHFEAGMFHKAALH